MSTVYVKTAAGQTEIRERRFALPRPARTMLVLVDGTRSREQVTAMVQGATPENFDILLEQGLIAPGAAAAATKRQAAVEAPGTARALIEAAPADSTATGTATATAAPNAAAAAAIDLDLPSSTSALGYRELYDSLTALAKDQLGLIKGYRFALEIEKARDLVELRQVAQRFVVEVSKSKGESAAQATRRALGLSR